MSEEDTLKKGQVVVGRYRIRRFVDEGGMQKVYEAEDQTFGRTVALKFPKNPSAEKRFRRSALLSARVNHPNVAKTLDFFEEDEREYLIEEFVEGTTLRSLYDVYPVLDPYLGCHLIHHLAKGVAAAHHAKVFHRDLKPSNIMISAGPWPNCIKVTDFGIARMAKAEIEDAVDLAVRESVTTSSTFLGALPYMAPELVEAQEGAGKSADIWSIGAIVFEGVAGRQPFGKGLQAVRRIVSGVPPEEPEVKGSKGQYGPIMKDLWAVILACMTSDASKRPTADELVAACSRLRYPVAQRETGIVTRYARDGGDFGFIEIGGGNSRFFHRASYYGGTPHEGDKVALTAYPSEGAARAHPVVPLKAEE